MTKQPWIMIIYIIQEVRPVLTLTHLHLNSVLFFIGSSNYLKVVPRTSLGPLLLAFPAKLITLIVRPVFGDLSLHPNTIQIICRFVLLLMNTHAFARLAYYSGKALCKKYSTHLDVAFGNYFLVICACQFHLPFYCSRTLPNVFSMIMITYAFSDWFEGKAEAQNVTTENTQSQQFYRASKWIVSTIVLFRCDMILLLFTVGLSMLIQRQMTVVKAIWIGLSSGIFSLLLTVSLDSIFWQRVVWPEGEVLFFNTVENKSSEWGIMPWHWYWTSALPKALVFTLFLIPLSILRVPEWFIQIVNFIFFRRDQNSQSKLALPPLFISGGDSSLNSFFKPIIAFVALYSILPHKEVRFLFPVLSMFNIVAANGMTRLHQLAFPPIKEKMEDPPKQNHSSTIPVLFIYLCGVATLLVSFLSSLLFLFLSHHNYPGGDALNRLQSYIEIHPKVKATTPLRVYIDVASAMTGVSLFGQRSAMYNPSQKGVWEFDKAGYEEENTFGKINYAKFTHLLSEEKEVQGYHIIGTAQGFPRLNWRELKINTQDAIFVLEKDGWI